MNINRRGFLKGIGALAALAVAPSIPAALVQSEMDRLMAKIATGVVSGETFYLDGPIVISGVNNLRITECRFVFKMSAPWEYLVKIEDAQNLIFSSCVLDATPGQSSKKAISYEDAELFDILSHAKHLPLA